MKSLKEDFITEARSTKSGEIARRGSRSFRLGSWIVAGAVGGLARDVGEPGISR
jgi:hypothetical protein